MELRDYQRECLDAVVAGFDSGIWSQLVVLPTGAGKTVVFAHLIEALGHFIKSHDWINRRVLVLAHRDELLGQAAAKIRAANPELTVEIERADERATPMAEVVVASVQTLAARNYARLDKFDVSRFRVVVVDEAHHAAAETYQGILRRLGLLAPDALLPKSKDQHALAAARASVRQWWATNNPGRLLLGVTATPSRTDAVGLEWTFQQLTFERSLRWMIDRGYLVEPRGFMVQTGINLDAVKTVAGDFQQKGLAEAVNTPERNGAIAAEWALRAHGRRTVVFAVDVQHAVDLAATFGSVEGTRASYVHGAMSTDDRRETLAAFGRGEIDVLANCQVLTEGFDEPSIGCVVLARPTKSHALYQQMIGRGLRLFDGKTDCLILDGGDNATRHSLVRLGDVFGLPKDFDLKGGKVTDAATAIDAIREAHPQLDLSKAATLGDIERMVKSIDLFAPTKSETVARFASLLWIQDAATSFHLPVPDVETNGAMTNKTGSRIVIGQGPLGDWHIVVRQKAQADYTVAYANDLQAAFQVGEKWVANNRPTMVALHDKDAAWRTRPPTAKQIEKLQQWGCKRLPTTRGEASDMMTAYIQRKRW